MKDTLFYTLQKIEDWVKSHEWKAYDPFDGLNAWIRPVAIGKIGRQLLLQGVRRSPLNLRPILNITPEMSTKAMGFFARGYLELFKITKDQIWAKTARDCLTWLLKNSSSGYDNLCWGNHFEYQSRVFYLPKNAPTVVWTSLIGHAFMDAWQILEDEEYLDAAKSVCLFIKENLEQRKEEKGKCISYIPNNYHPVHNANMLAASILARTYKYHRNESFKRIASDAVEYTLESQHSDGSWWYGEAIDLRWIDNFHTGYILDSLWWYMSSVDNWEPFSSFERGLRFFLENFITDNGVPKYYHNKLFPIDIQCASQTIDTLSFLAKESEQSYKLIAEKVASWTIENMQDKDGHFYFRIYRYYTNKTPMLHWGQATMFKSLASLLSLMNG